MVDFPFLHMVVTIPNPVSLSNCANQLLGGVKRIQVAILYSDTYHTLSVVLGRCKCHMQQLYIQLKLGFEISEALRL